MKLDMIYCRQCEAIHPPGRHGRIKRASVIDASVSVPVQNHSARPWRQFQAPDSPSKPPSEHQECQGCLDRDREIARLKDQLEARKDLLSLPVTKAGAVRKHGHNPDTCSRGAAW